MFSIIFYSSKITLLLAKHKKRENTFVISQKFNFIFMKQFAIIVAGGMGQRFGGQIPKQFLTLKGLPVLMHTLNVFHTFDSTIEMILTLPAGYIEIWNSLCKEYKYRIKHKIVAGGETRFHSVKNGLDVIQDKSGIVAVHDGVRPLVNKDTLLRCFETAYRTGNAIPVTSITDSVRKLQNDISKPVNRDDLVLVQTPQVFDLKLLKDAYLQQYIPEFKDDANVVEKLGVKIILVEGNPENIKITTQADMLIAETLMNKSNGLR